MLVRPANHPSPLEGEGGGEGEPLPSNKKAWHRRAVEGGQPLSGCRGTVEYAGADRKQSPEGRTQGDRKDATRLEKRSTRSAITHVERHPICLADTRTGQFV